MNKIRVITRKWHSSTLEYHNAIMFETLVHNHNIITESTKHYSFEDELGDELSKIFKGVLAMKEVNGRKVKYFIDEKRISELPIRINDHEELFFKESARSRSVVLIPTSITPFRITPKQMWSSNKEFIDNIAPFEHSNPDQWTLSKLVAIMAYVGKSFCCICSESEFGKSSIYSILDAITQKSPVFQPRTVPGVLAQINETGNMVFDEVHGVASDVRDCMENFALQVGGNAPIYINGAMRNKNTKAKYDVAEQSITFLYNILSNYKDPSKQFWDYIWKNQIAMDSRFLKLRFKGKLMEEFDKGFNIIEEAKENKMLYINIAKHLLYLKDLKKQNKHDRKWIHRPTTLTGRHKGIYDELTWMIDVYSESQEEYDKFIALLDHAINSYEGMKSQEVEVEEQEITPFTQFEEVKTPKDRILEYIKENPDKDSVQLEKELNIREIDKELAKLANRGEIFEIAPDKWRLLS